MPKIPPRILIVVAVVVVLVVAGVVVLANGRSSKASSDDQASAEVGTDTTVAGADSSTSVTDGSATTSYDAMHRAGPSAGDTRFAPAPPTAGPSIHATSKQRERPQFGKRS